MLLAALLTLFFPVSFFPYYCQFFLSPRYSPLINLVLIQAFVDVWRRPLLLTHCCSLSKWTHTAAFKLIHFR